MSKVLLRFIVLIIVYDGHVQLKKLKLKSFEYLLQCVICFFIIIYKQLSRLHL